MKQILLYVVDGNLMLTAFAEDQTKVNSDGEAYEVIAPEPQVPEGITEFHWANRDDVPDDRDERETWARDVLGLPVTVIVPSVDPIDYPLTPDQFTWLLAVSGLDDVTEDVLAYAKATDRAQFADLKMALNRSAFHFDVTMGMINQMSEAIPEGVDVSAETIGDLWMLAKDK